LRLVLFFRPRFPPSLCPPSPMRKPFRLSKVESPGPCPFSNSLSHARSLTKPSVLCAHVGEYQLHQNYSAPPHNTFFAKEYGPASTPACPPPVAPSVLRPPCTRGCVRVALKVARFVVPIPVSSSTTKSVFFFWARSGAAVWLLGPVPNFHPPPPGGKRG